MRRRLGVWTLRLWMRRRTMGGGSSAGCICTPLGGVSLGGSYRAEVCVLCRSNM